MHRLLSFYYLTFAMGFALLPKSFVGLRITVELTKSTLLIVHVPSLILLTVRPRKYSLTMHFSAPPIPLVHSPIRPDKVPFSLEFIILECSVIFLLELCSNQVEIGIVLNRIELSPCFIRGHVEASHIDFVIYVFPFKHTAVSVDLVPFSTPQVILPPTFVIVFSPGHQPPKPFFFIHCQLSLVYFIDCNNSAFQMRNTPLYISLILECTMVDLPNPMREIIVPLPQIDPHTWHIRARIR